jgi:hypothetical protein
MYLDSYIYIFNLWLTMKNKLVEEYGQIVENRRIKLVQVKS